MLKCPASIILAAFVLLSSDSAVLALSSEEQEVVLPDSAARNKKFDPQEFVIHEHLLDFEHLSLVHGEKFKSVGTLRGAMEENSCLDIDVSSNYVPSERAQDEMLAYALKLALNPPTGSTYSFNYKREWPTYVKELQQECTEQGGSNWLISVSTAGCEALKEAFEEANGLGSGMNLHIKNQPLCLTNCTDPQALLDNLATVDSSCGGAVTIKSSAFTMTANAFLVVGAFVTAIVMM